MPDPTTKGLINHSLVFLSIDRDLQGSRNVKIVIIILLGRALIGNLITSVDDLRRIWSSSRHVDVDVFPKKAVLLSRVVRFPSREVELLFPKTRLTYERTD